MNKWLIAVSIAVFGALLGTVVGLACLQKNFHSVRLDSLSFESGYPEHLHLFA